MSEIIPIGRKPERAENPVETSTTDLEAIAKKNADNAKRVKEEREKANKAVIRSYRLKH